MGNEISGELTELKLSRSLHWSIVYASARLKVNKWTEKLLEHTAWAILLYILNFTSLNKTANGLLQKLPMLLVNYRPLFDRSLWSSNTSDSSIKDRKKRLNKLKNRMVFQAQTVVVWLAIVMLLHNDASPFRSSLLCRAVERTYNTRWLFWTHTLIFRIGTNINGAGALALTWFFIGLRVWKFVSRTMVKPMFTLLFYAVVDWWEPKSSFVIGFLIKAFISVTELHILGYIAIFGVDL
jgi:hypothetical protein